jgi:hypothetical protein
MTLDTMTKLIRRFPATVSNARGAFSVSVIARDTGGDTWEGWLEFAPAAPNGTSGFVTGIETRQHDRRSLERWASGLTSVYAEGALARALDRQPDTPTSELLAALQEIVEALDRRLPRVERANEEEIAADARRLRAGAIRRIEALQQLAGVRA